MLYLEFNFSIEIQERLRELEQARRAIDPYARLPQEYTGELRRHALAQTVHYSTQIEGNTLTFEQVQDLLTGEIVAAPRDQVQEAENYREAMAYVQSVAAGARPWPSQDTIKAIHYLITKSLPGQYAPGRYRTEQNYIVDRRTGTRIFVPPGPEDVPSLMDEFIAWVNSADETPAVLKAALAHLNLAAIHPFLDGNGRAARVVDSLMLYRGGFRDQDLVSLEAYFGRDNQGYYRALASALGPHYTPPKDCTPWVEYYLRAHVEQASLTLQEIGQMVAELDGLREAFTAEGLAVWQMVALWLACRRGRITNRSYRAVAQRSPQSAAADLAKLVGMRLLERVGRGRATRYAPTEEVLRTFDAIRNAHQGVDL